MGGAGSLLKSTAYRMKTHRHRHRHRPRVWRLPEGRGVQEVIEGKGGQIYGDLTLGGEQAMHYIEYVTIEMYSWN